MAFASCMVQEWATKSTTGEIVPRICLQWGGLSLPLRDLRGSTGVMRAESSMSTQLGLALLAASCKRTTLAIMFLWTTSQISAIAETPHEKQTPPVKRSLVWPALSLQKTSWDMNCRIIKAHSHQLTQTHQNPSPDAAGGPHSSNDNPLSSSPSPFKCQRQSFRRELRERKLGVRFLAHC